MCAGVPTLAGVTDPIDTLRLGEEATIRGHAVRRVGLCGDGAYLVDGEALSHEAAGWVIATPVPGPQEKAPRAPRAAAVEKPVPELLQAVRDALPGRRGLRFQHRAFAGGEAVEIRATGTEAAARQELEVDVMQAVLRARLHVEWAPGGYLVAAWNRAALAPSAAPQGTKKKQRAA